MSAFLIQSSAAESGEQYGSSLDERAYLMWTEPMTLVQKTMAEKSKHLQYQRCQVRDETGHDRNPVARQTHSPMVSSASSGHMYHLLLVCLGISIETEKSVTHCHLHHTKAPAAASCGGGRPGRRRPGFGRRAAASVTA
jgi:hypothetical protein